MTDTLVERIAARLTEAQREAVLSAEPLEWWFNMVGFKHGRSAKALHRLGLTNLAWVPTGLTPLGLAVRAELEKEPQ